MSKPRKAKKPGPLPHQQRMRSARDLHRLERLAGVAVVVHDSVVHDSFKAAIAALPAARDAVAAAIGGAPPDSDWRLP